MFPSGYVQAICKERIIQASCREWMVQASCKELNLSCKEWIVQASGKEKAVQTTVWPWPFQLCRCAFPYHLTCSHLTAVSTWSSSWSVQARSCAAAASCWWAASMLRRYRSSKIGHCHPALQIRFQPFWTTLQSICRSRASSLLLRPAAQIREAVAGLGKVFCQCLKQRHSGQRWSKWWQRCVLGVCASAEGLSACNAYQSVVKCLWYFIWLVLRVDCFVCH